MTDGALMRWPVFPRESMIDIPNAGFPTYEEQTWRRRAPETLRERRVAMFRGRSFARWGADLVGPDVRAGLRAVRYLRHFLIVHEERIVRRARDGGLCWDEIGVYLGLERQTVHRRWAARIRDGSAALPRIQAPSRARVIDP